MTTTLFALCAVSVAAILLLIAYVTTRKRLAAVQQTASDNEKKLLAEKNEAQTAQAIASDRLQSVSDKLEQVQQQAQHNAQEWQQTTQQQTAEIAKITAINQNLQEKIDTQKAELENLQQRLTTEFENIANRVLKARADEFATHSEKNIGALLNPLGERITDFKKQVAEAYDKEMRDKISLREEVKKLTELNTRVSEEANNLTKALKGDVKKQGNWGEVILERVLETSGLTKGVEYDREVVVQGADGETLRPDVIVRLPEQKQIVIDSKVSLIAYERWANATDDESAAKALHEHLESLRKHVDELSRKNYPNANGLNAPDFVLMFVPIEASFAVAVQSDNELYSYAWERKIVIVSPTTLLATLRTISSIWKQENQTRNAQEIARLSGSLYDKFVGFAIDMEKIRSSIDAAAKNYDSAMNKMRDGNGNILRTAERIKSLGAKTGTKTLPSTFQPD